MVPGSPWGAEHGTVDYALKQQVVAAGVDLRFERTVEHLPDGGIVAHGPHRPDAIAVGYVFETDQADGAYAVVSDELAPKGYAYLLICGGRGTVASCMFADFHNEKRYRDRTVAFFEDRVGVHIANPRPFGGFGNVYAAPVARKGNLLYVGEAAGFQDALFGFGIRYAMVSGQLAARAWIEGDPQRFDRLWRERLDGLLRLALVNRYLYERLGDGGYAGLMRRIDRARDARRFLRRWYTRGMVRRLLYPLARRSVAGGRRALLGHCPADCDCTWCRCAHASPGQEDRKAAVLTDS